MSLEVEGRVGARGAPPPFGNKTRAWEGGENLIRANQNRGDYSDAVM